MLDSLVRVSRRVGRGADRFATDPGRRSGAGRSRTRGGRDALHAVRPYRTPREGQPARASWRARLRVPRPSGRPTPPRAVTLPAEARSHLPEGLVAAREPVVALSPRKVRPPTAVDPPAPSSRIGGPAGAARRRVEFRGSTLRSRPFASERFHVLLNSLFKVLCNFPSRYLFAIGLALGI